jgi:hypothetical protein
MLGSFAAFAAEGTANGAESVFDLRGWAYARERKTLTGSNRVTAAVTLKNSSKLPASDVTLTLNLATGAGEKVAAPLTQKVGSVKPNESKAVTFSAEFVPVFQSYTISIQFNGGAKEEWYGNSDSAQPESKNPPARGQAVVLILGKEGTVDKSGVFNGIIHVKNEGTEDAKNLKISATFFDMKKNKLKEWTGPLGNGALSAGAEQKIAFTIPGAPRNYGSYVLKLNHDDAPPEAALAGGEFSGVEDVEFAHYKFTRPDAKEARYKVEAECRNGLKVAAEHVKLELIFYGPKKREIKRFGHELPGTVLAGETKPVSFEISGLPAYEEYEQRVSYGKQGGSAAPSPDAAKVKFTNKSEVEVVFGPLTVNADKVVEIAGGVRNGKNFPIKAVAVHVTLLKADGSELTSVDRILPSTLKPGEEKEIIISAEKATGAANFKYTYKFESAVDKPGVKEREKNPLDSAL